MAAGKKTDDRKSSKRKLDVTCSERFEKKEWFRAKAKEMKKQPKR